MALAHPKTYLPHLAILIGILATIAVVSRPRTFHGNPEAPITFTLPERLGPYVGQALWFCSNDQCARSFTASELPDAVEGFPCPPCEAPLSVKSIGEARILPATTPILRRLYTTPGTPQLQCSFVFSGAERDSIHRPQVCLVSQGNTLINEYTYHVKISDTERLPITVLETMREHKDASGTKHTTHGVYAYWFFNPRRQIESHWKRLYYLTLDNALRNYRPRWAYVSIAFAPDSRSPESYHKILNDFIPLLLPVVREIQHELRLAEQE